MMDLRDFKIERIEFSDDVRDYLNQNLELKQGFTRLFEFIRMKQAMQELDAQIPVMLSTKNGSWIKAELVALDGDEVMTSEGKGSFMVHKIQHLVGLYPPLIAV